MHCTHFSCSFAPADLSAGRYARHGFVTVFHRPLATLNVDVLLVGRMPKDTFPLTWRNRETLYDKFVILQQ
jgi:hypothetical protein